MASLRRDIPRRDRRPDLEELRTVFRRKSFVSRQEQLCRALLSEGRSPLELAAMRLGDVPPSQDLEKYLERRRELGLDVSEGAPLVVDPDGNRIPEEAVVEHLRFARTIRVSIEGNAGLCRGLLETRYGGERGVGERPEKEEDRMKAARLHRYDESIPQDSLEGRGDRRAEDRRARSTSSSASAPQGSAAPTSTSSRASGSLYRTPTVRCYPTP